MTKGIILAAGRGSRLGEQTQDKPKCLVELWGKPLLQWQIEALRGAGIEDITIVRGYQAEKIAVPGVSYLENPRWADTNMVATLMEAREILAGGVTVVSYSDIVYTPQAVEALLKGHGDIRITYDPDWRQLWEMRFEDPLSDAETFKLDAATGRLIDIGKRPQSYDEVQGQYMGLLYFEPAGWARVAHLAANLEAGVLSKMDCTTLLRGLIGDGSVHAFPIPDRWYEVDNGQDLARYSEFRPFSQ